jgi:multidrug efflux pump subunit AcrA (membrane-fusion protein)
MSACLLVILVALAGQVELGTDESPAAVGGDLDVGSCQIKIRDEVNLPAPEAGVLMEFAVREGSQVKQGDVLAMIDDREAQAALRVAQFRFEAATKRSEDTIEEKYAVLAAAVAKADWQKSLEANKRNPGSIVPIDIDQKKLVFDRSTLQIEKAVKDRELAVLDARTAEAERDAANLAIERRTIRSPFNGEVANIYNRHQSEWVSPGDPIVRLIQLDTLYIETTVDASRYERNELQGKPVTVQVTGARNRKENAVGHIVYVGQEIQGGTNYRVQAEFTNRLQGDQWLIQPGHTARMTIHLGQTNTAAR